MNSTWISVIKAEHRQPFDKIKHRHPLKVVGDVVESKYDWRIDGG